MNSKTLWQDQYPPENIEKIYDDCTTQLQEIKSTLDSMCNEYSIDDQHVIRTLTAYSRHLTRLKAVVGLSEIKSAKTMTDVIKIVKNNIEFTRREHRRAADLMVKEKQRELEESGLETATTKSGDLSDAGVKKVEPKKSFQSTRFEDEVFSDEEGESEKKADDDTSLASKLDLSNTISYLQKRRARTIEPFDKLKRSDSIITPILVKAKKERILVSTETEEDLGYLQKLLEHTFKALDEYGMIIEKVEKLCLIFEKYFLSFYNFVDFLLLEKKSDSAMSTSYKDSDVNKVG